MDDRSRAGFHTTPMPAGGGRGRFGMSGLSRHPVRILMVVGGLILLVVIFFIAILTVDGSGDKKDKVAGTTSASGTTSSSKPSKSAAEEGTSAAPTTPGTVGARPGSIPGTVHAGSRLVMYKGTSYQSEKIVQIETGTRVRVNCHAEGSVAYYAGSSSRTWAQIDVEGKTGFVPVVFLDTGGEAAEQVRACES